MSPSSAGVKTTPGNNVGVERYIGSYLIQTTTARPKHQIQRLNKNYNYQRHNSNPQDVKHKDTNNRYVTPPGSANDNWVDGTTLYSYPCRGNIRKCHQQQQPTPSSPPARNEKFHPQTQLSRLAIHTQGIPLILTGRNNNSSRKTNHNYPQKCNNNYIDMGGVRYNMPPPSIDPTKVKSDNNSVSVATDTLSVASDESSSSNNSENCLPRIIKPRKRRKKDRKPPQTTQILKVNTSDTQQTVTPPVTPSDISSDIPNLNHDFDDIQELTNQQNHCSPTSCQCKLCDPCGQIWNVDSSFLTGLQFTNSDYNAPSTVDKMVSTLRRSWSDPMPDHHLRVKSNGDVGVIGSGRYSSSSNSLNNVTQIKNSQKLNISTEIVTSPNGHRDLEIKFLSFSCSPAQNTSKHSSDDNIVDRLQRLSEEKDYDLSYDTTQISRLLLTVEE
ncbi:uncharacterized protein LOC123292165 [Chrysoperla carnea]|uniref:uncharacterized protein LOC123292165 n=1 Tax=Chrysoperla carnea TaxID=189513 RepID=UPI001D07625E|nr:uncharacterized protein LOC123292165 [Chrysoperla carnea]